MNKETVGVTGIQGPGMGACRDRVGHVSENPAWAH